MTLKTRQEGGRRTKDVARKYTEGQPVISIVTVVFNDRQHIEDIIVNVRAQTYPNIDYLIIDGGSTDGTLDVIKKHDDGIDYWLSEPDKGIYDAMNKGVSAAAGVWVNFMNSGDSFYLPTTIADIVRAMPSSADLVYGHTYYRETDKMTLIETYNLDQLWMSMIFSHQSLFVKTALLREHPFDTGFRISSDFDFIYHCYVNKRIFFDTKQIIAVHAVDGVSEQNIISRMVERWRIVNRYTPSFRANLFYFKLLFRKCARVWRRGS